jgi:hypothetical protein
MPWFLNCLQALATYKNACGESTISTAVEKMPDEAVPQAFRLPTDCMYSLGIRGRGNPRQMKKMAANGRNRNIVDPLCIACV